MRFKIRHIAFVGLLLMLPLIINGQNVKVSASAPGSVRNGQQFYYTITANGQIQNIQLPDLPDFNYLGGPNTSMSTCTACFSMVWR